MLEVSHSDNSGHRFYFTTYLPLRLMSDPYNELYQWKLFRIHTQSELLTSFSFCSSLPFRIVVGNTIVGLVDNTDQVYMLIVFLSQAYVFE